MDEKQLKDFLESKRAKIQKAVEDARYAALQTKSWAKVAHDEAEKVLNYIRDLNLEAEKILKEIPAEAS